VSVVGVRARRVPSLAASGPLTTETLGFRRKEGVSAGADHCNSSVAGASLALAETTASRRRQDWRTERQEHDEEAAVGGRLGVALRGGREPFGLIVGGQQGRRSCALVELDRDRAAGGHSGLPEDSSSNHV